MGQGLSQYEEEEYRKLLEIKDKLDLTLQKIYFNYEEKEKTNECFIELADFILEEVNNIIS